MLRKWHRISQVPPSFNRSPLESLQTLPDLAGLVEGSDAAMPFPDTVLYPPSPQSASLWRWLLIALVSSCAAGGIGVGAFLWLINLPPNVDCQNAATLSTDRAQLYCAQISAQSGDLADVVTSLELVRQWTPEHPLYEEVQPLINQWSETVLVEAREKLNHNDLSDAIALINRIPPSSANYKVAQAELAEWRQEWQVGQALYTKGQEALQQKDWKAAFAQVVALSDLNNAYWRVEQVQTLSEQIWQEKQAQRLLAQAKATAAPGGLNRLSGALRAAAQIKQGTYTWQEARPFLDNWSNQLLSVATDKWYAAELDEAISLSHRAALNPNHEQMAQELIWLSQARKLALKSDSNWQTSSQEWGELYQAMLLVNQIGPESRFYPQAQSSLATWKVHLQDLSQLQVAQTLGQFRNRETLEGAIAQAATIPADHPRRQQAQTLISHWHKEIQRIEDQPYLVKAHKLAQLGSIEQLNAAVVAASQISLDRALRSEAQDWIYVWNYQIATLEDQPTIARARALASQGNWSQAIVEAKQIQPSRPLYREARNAISEWKARIRAIEVAQQRARQDLLEASTETSQLQVEAKDDLMGDTPDAEVEPETTPRTRRSQPATTDYVPETNLPNRIYTVPADEPPTPAPPKPLQPSQPAPAGEAPTPPSRSTAPSPLSNQSPPPALGAPPPALSAPNPIDFAPPTKEEKDSISQNPDSKKQPVLALTEPAVVYLGSLYAGR